MHYTHLWQTQVEADIIIACLNNFKFGKEPEDVFARTIDGKEGAISPACNKKIFIFGYPMITIDNADLMLATVLASSTYPWDKGTSSLVKTIHVEVSSSKNGDIQGALSKLKQVASEELTRRAEEANRSKSMAVTT